MLEVTDSEIDRLVQMISSRDRSDWPLGISLILELTEEDRGKVYMILANRSSSPERSIDTYYEWVSRLKRMKRDYEKGT